MRLRGIYAQTTFLSDGVNRECAMCIGINFSLAIFVTAPLNRIAVRFASITVLIVCFARCTSNQREQQKKNPSYLSIFRINLMPKIVGNDIHVQQHCIDYNVYAGARARAPSQSFSVLFIFSPRIFILKSRWSFVLATSSTSVRRIGAAT